MITVKLPRAYYYAGRVDTDELSQILKQGLWSMTGVEPADVRVSLHEGTSILASGCEVGAVTEILKLGENNAH
ncbi:hypothetical protein L2090_23180 [Rahnella victoriana]|nr:hypothetical protein [Rahnella victoriana]